MAIEQIWHDLNGMKIGVLKDWRLNPLTTVDRVALGDTLTASHIGLPAFDADEAVLYMWDGVKWVASGGGVGTELDQIEEVQSFASISNRTDKRFVIVRVDETQYNVGTLYIYTPTIGLRLLQLIP